MSLLTPPRPRPSPQSAPTSTFPSSFYLSLYPLLSHHYLFDFICSHCFLMSIVRIDLSWCGRWVHRSPSSSKRTISTWRTFLFVSLSLYFFPQFPVSLCFAIAIIRKVIACAYSPNGKFFATCSEDRSIRLWNPLANYAQLLYSTFLALVFSFLFRFFIVTIFIFSSLL